MEEVDLKPGGRDIEVKEENKLEYIQCVTEIVSLEITPSLFVYRLMIKWRFEDRVKLQMDAFKKVSALVIMIILNVIPAGV